MRFHAVMLCLGMCIFATGALEAATTTVTFGFHNRSDDHPEGGILAACAGTTGLKNPLNDGTELQSPIPGELNVDKGDLSETWEFPEGNCPIVHVNVTEIWDVRGDITLKVYSGTELMETLTALNDSYNAYTHSPPKFVTKIVSSSATTPPEGSLNSGGHIVIDATHSAVYGVRVEGDEDLPHAGYGQFTATLLNEYGEDIEADEGYTVKWEFKAVPFGSNGEEECFLIGDNMPLEAELSPLVRAWEVVTQEDCEKTFQDQRVVVTYTDPSCNDDPVSGSMDITVQKGNPYPASGLGDIQAEVLTPPTFVSLDQEIDVATRICSAHGEDPPADCTHRARTRQELNSSIEVLDGSSGIAFGRWQLSPLGRHDKSVVLLLVDGTATENPDERRVTVRHRVEVSPLPDCDLKTDFTAEIQNYESTFELGERVDYDSGYSEYCYVGKYKANTQRIVMKDVTLPTNCTNN